MKIKGLISVELSADALGLDDAAACLQSARGTGCVPPDTASEGGTWSADQVEMVKERVSESLVRSFTVDAISKLVVYTEGRRIRLMALVETESAFR